MRANVVYLWNGRVHASETRRTLDLKVGRGGMKRLMKEAVAHHAETVHYSASVGIRVGGGEARKMNEAGFWTFILEGLVGARGSRGFARGSVSPSRTGPNDARLGS